jgi:hypothetical protein
MQGEATQSAAEAEASSVPVTIGAGWPVTVEQADALYKRARLTRSLIELRDATGGRPSLEKQAEPAQGDRTRL